MENDLFNQLLAIGKTGDFSQISSLTGAGSWDEVIKITPHGNGIDSFCKQLPEDEKIAFIKAVAAYENTVGPFGSVTSLVRLLPLIEDNEAVFDWVLKNTDSYIYYSNGAKSFEEYDNFQKQKQERRIQSLDDEKKDKRWHKTIKQKKLLQTCQKPY